MRENNAVRSIVSSVRALADGAAAMLDWNSCTCLSLVVATIAVYFPAITFESVVLDDYSYLRRPEVEGGISLSNLLWAMTTIHGDLAYWHPLTWMSHQLDCELFGLRVGAHHFTNVLLHAATTLLLFRFLTEATGRGRLSLAIAALFCLHPLQVESVAWISERKGLLAGFFWMATLWAYVRYTRTRSRSGYGLVLFCFACGLMSKPSVVALPFVLLFLDFWPLGRYASDNPHPKDGLRASLIRLVLLEKAPMFVLSAAVSVATFLAQWQVGAVVRLDEMPATYRAENAAVSYLLYLCKVFWPSHLSPIYVHRGHWPFLLTALACAVLLGLLVVALRVRRTRPHVLFGWLWFLVSLFPMIGLVQVGAQSMADRYAYLPMVGLLLPSALEVGNALRKLRPAAAHVLTLTTLVALSFATRYQLHHWETSVSLFDRAVKLSPANYMAHYHLAVSLRNEGRLDEACEHFKGALRLAPGSTIFRTALVSAELEWSTRMLEQGNAPKALQSLTEVLRVEPNNLQAHYLFALICASHADAQCRNATAALQHALFLTKTHHSVDYRFLEVLAAAYAENHNFSEAAALQAKACASVPQEAPALKEMRERLELYRQDRPYHWLVRPGRGLLCDTKPLMQ